MIKELGCFLTAGSLLMGGCSYTAKPDTNKAINIAAQDQIQNNPNTLIGTNFKITRLSKDVFWIQGNSIRDENVRGGLRYINNRCEVISISDLGSSKTVYGGSLNTTIVVVVRDGKCVDEITPWQ